MAVYLKFIWMIKLSAVLVGNKGAEYPQDEIFHTVT